MLGRAVSQSGSTKLSTVKSQSSQGTSNTEQAELINLSASLIIMRCDTFLIARVIERPTAPEHKQQHVSQHAE